MAAPAVFFQGFKAVFLVTDVSSASLPSPVVFQALSPCLSFCKAVCVYTRLSIQGVKCRISSGVNHHGDGERRDDAL